ncbi:MAG: hypothetical protein Q7S52_04895 [bacterium]|nr:hypothetical protein [bacterium]
MNTPRIGRVLEPLCVDFGFRFDQASPELQKIKSELCRGHSVALTFTDEMTDENGEKSPTMLVSFLIVSGRKYLEDMREVHGEYVVEVPGQNIMELGMPRTATKAIMDMLAASCDVYLVPHDDIGGVAGRYTLVGRAF